MRALSKLMSRPITRAAFCALMLVALSGASCSSTAAPPIPDIPEKVEPAISAKQVIERFREEQIASIVEAYQHDQDDLMRRLQELGYADINGFSAENVSAQPLLAFAARRAEAGRAGDAERLLATLAKPIIQSSAAAATDTKLASLRSFSAADLAQPFVFSTDTATVDAITLPAAVERAIEVLASYAWPHANLSAALLVNLNKQGFDGRQLDLIAQKAPNLGEFIRRAVAAGTPPPLPAQAVLEIIAEVRASSAIAMTDPAFDLIMHTLRAPLPPIYEAMRDREELTPTSIAELDAQRAGARDEGLPLVDDSDWRGNRGPRKPGEPPSPSTPPMSGPLTIEGGTKGIDQGGYAERVRGSFGKWDRDTFGIGAGGGGGGLPRSFRTASISIRGPGGVSLGAAMTVNASDVPVAAIWVPKPTVPEFGYYLVTLRGSDGKTRSALSRVMYAESASAASRIIWPTGQGAIPYKEGEIVPLVSMNLRDIPQTPAEFEKFAADHPDMIKRLRNRERPVVVNPALAGLQVAWNAVRADFWMRWMQGAKQDISVLLPGTDFSSALQAYTAASKPGTWQIREAPYQLMVGTSAGLARVYTCFSAQRCNADAPDPAFDIVLFDADAIVPQCDIDPACTPAKILADIDKDSPEASVKRLLEKYPAFASKLSPANRLKLVKMKAGQMNADKQAVAIRPGETLGHWRGRMAGSLPLLPGENARADAASRYIRWLATHHPDFIRLNDVREALALTRWLSANGIRPKAPDALFAPRPLPVPNWIKGGSEGEPLIAFSAN